MTFKGGKIKSPWNGRKKIISFLGETFQKHFLYLSNSIFNSALIFKDLFLILFSADLLTGLNGWTQMVHKQLEEKDACLSISSPAVVLTACYSQPLKNHHSTLLLYLYRGKAAWKVSLSLLFFSCMGWFFLMVYLYDINRRIQ